MVNLITLLLLLTFGFWIIRIVSRKKHELAEKESQQRKQFLKDTQFILQNGASSFCSTPQKEVDPFTFNQSYPTRVAEYFTSHGYAITESAKAEGIDLIGFKNKELLLIRCETASREVKKIDLQIFIANCTTYIDKNPMLQMKSFRRFYATKSPINEEAMMYVRENPASIQLMEEV